MQVISVDSYPANLAIERGPIWVANLLDDRGAFLALQFDHAPTDDEIAAAAPSPRALRPSTIAGRIQRAAQLAEAWQALNTAATAAAADASWTAQQKNRIAAARDAAWTALGNFV